MAMKTATMPLTIALHTLATALILAEVNEWKRCVDKLLVCVHCHDSVTNGAHHGLELFALLACASEVTSTEVLTHDATAPMITDARVFALR